MRWLKVFISWLADQAIEHWVTILSVVGGGLMSYFASISNWLSPYGFVAWGGVGVVTILLLSLAFFLFGVAREKVTIANYTMAKSTATGTNTLASVHQDERIDLSTFYHPYFRATEDARFENCELFGPALIFADGCNFLHGSFIDCEIVIVRPDRPVKGVMAFKHCSFVRFTLYRATLLMNIEMYKSLPDEVKKMVPIISDGRVGDI